MAVRIRLKRLGRRNRPFYRIAVFDGRTRRDGRSIEEIGFYDTASNREQTLSEVNVERARYWLGVGAQPTRTVHEIFKRNGVYDTSTETAVGEATSD